MGTPARFAVFLGGTLVANAWSLHAAHEKLTSAVLLRARDRGSFPVEGQIFDPQGRKVSVRSFPGYIDSEGVSHGE